MSRLIFVLCLFFSYVSFSVKLPDEQQLREKLSALDAQSGLKHGVDAIAVYKDFDIHASIKSFRDKRNQILLEKAGQTVSSSFIVDMLKDLQSKQWITLSNYFQGYEGEYNPKIIFAALHVPSYDAALFDILFEDETIANEKDESRKEWEDYVISEGTNRALLLSLTYGCIVQ